MQRKDGFTLIELLIAMIVLAAISMMVYISFSSVLNTMEIARLNAEDLNARRYLQENISHNLRAVYAEGTCVDPTFQFIHEDGNGAGGDADTLRFAASLPMPGTRSMPGQYIEVIFELAESSGEEEEDDLSPVDVEGGGYVFRITERPLIMQAMDLEFGGDDFEPIERVREVPASSLNFRFYDIEEEDWVDSWDSLEMERLPWAVEASVYFDRGFDANLVDYQAGIDAAENPDMIVMVTLPIAMGVEEPFVDFNHIRHIGENDNVDPEVLDEEAMEEDMGGMDDGFTDDGFTDDGMGDDDGGNNNDDGDGDES